MAAEFFGGSNELRTRGLGKLVPALFGSISANRYVVADIFVGLQVLRGDGARTDDSDSHL
jgi:hypothetical protein